MTPSDVTTTAVTSAGESEFYVGYIDPAPRELGQRIRWLAATSLLVAVGAAVAVGLGQRTLPEAHFEFGQVRAVQGYLVMDPYPSVLTPEGRGVIRHLLVAKGKRGAANEVKSLAGRWVSLNGTLIRRGGQTMLEIEPGSLLESVDQPARPGREPIEDLGIRYVEGEIVGSKCYLGVMNPGSGVTHRACASLCMRGGVPPMLAISDAEGATEGVLLVAGDGTPLGDALLDLAAAAVGVTGRVIRVGATTFIHVDPNNIRRLE